MLNEQAIQAAIHNPNLVKQEKARRRLIDFIRYTMPHYKVGWVHTDICKKLEWFYNEVMAKRSPRLILCMPPRHGKSEIVSRRFPAWLLGKNPNLNIISTSYSTDLATAMNLDVQRIIDDEPYREVFKQTFLMGKAVKGIANGNYVRNSEKFEIVNHRGYYRCAGVGGGITGMGADIFIIDDPIKDHKEANSATIRENIWDWFRTTALTRVSPGGGVVILMTRWHTDDLVGKLLEGQKQENYIDNDEKTKWDVIKYKAIADKDERHRLKGEALHPERYNINALNNFKTNLGSYHFESLYQQEPYVRGGGMFSVEGFKIVENVPGRITNMVRYWDKAGTDDDGAFTAGVKVGKLKDGRFIVLDVVRGQWSALKREQRIKLTAELDTRKTKIRIEQEPGSGGKESAEATTRNLKGFIIKAERATGDKAVRAEPYAAQVEAGNVLVLQGTWNKAFIDEHESFPRGKYKDQVDAASGAFNTLASLKTDYTSLEDCR